MNHQNRSKRADAPGRNPKPAEIVQLRDEMQRTQSEFGALVYRGRDVVAKWEAGERRMPPDTWEYLCLLHGFPQVARARDEWLASFT
jgi:DNA-binding transcriptional regulator YiaG